MINTARLSGRPHTSDDRIFHTTRYYQLKREKNTTMIAKSKRWLDFVSGDKEITPLLFGIIVSLVVNEASSKIYIPRST